MPQVPNGIVSELARGTTPNEHAAAFEDGSADDHLAVGELLDERPGQIIIVLGDLGYLKHQQLVSHVDRCQADFELGVLDVRDNEAQESGGVGHETGLALTSREFEAQL